MSRERSLISIKNSGCDLRFHLVYPNNYWVGMSNLGFQAVYGILASTSGVMVERGFLPENHGAQKVKSKTWRTLEHERILSDCDLLGFSLSFETDYPHLLSILSNLKLLEHDPLVRADKARKSSLGQPLLIAGGTAVTLNPEPIAELIDIMVIGEAEELIVELVEVLRRARREGWDRLRTLREASGIEGIYVPRFHRICYEPDGTIASFEHDSNLLQKPRRRFVKDLSKFPTYSRILTPETEFSSMFLTETGRGCEIGCRFCVAGYIYRPVRKRSEEAIAETVKVGLKNSEAVGFVGAAVSSHRAIAKLASSVAKQGGRASLSSIMSQMVTAELAASITESEYRTVALAPEAGSERLRFAAGKRVKNSQVIDAARLLAQAGIRGFKLYFIVGLPTETDQDVEAIAALAREVRDVVVQAGRAAKRHSWVTLSVNPFIPKAWTPFQWEPMLDRRVLAKKIKSIEKLIKGVRNLEMKFEPPKESYFQALLSRGDRRVVRLLLYLESNGLDWKWLMKHTAETVLEGVPPVDFYVARRIPFDEFLPWDMIDARIDKALLKREALRAHALEPGRGAAAMVAQAAAPSEASL